MGLRDGDYLTFSACLKEFVHSTSTHGLHRVGWSKNGCAKFIWTILFLVTLCIFIIFLTLMSKNYYKYPVKTIVSKKVGHQPFPGVTLCNINPLRQSEIKDTVLEAYRQFVLTGNWNISAGAYGNTTDPYLRQRNTFIKVLSSKIEYIEDRVKIGHQLRDLVLHCAFDGRECDREKDFIHVWNDIYGNCYTFSGGKVDTNFSAKAQKEPGPLRGLVLILDTESINHLRSMTDSKGIRILIHPSTDMPFPEEGGISLPAGMEAQISVDVQEYRYSGAPYHKCQAPYVNQYDYSYSTIACQKVCKQEKVLERCLCLNPTLPVNGNEKICTINELYSAEYSCHGQVMQAYVDGKYTCDCPVPCEETRYETDFSLAKWPSTGGIKDNGIPNSCIDKMGQWADSECYQHLFIGDAPPFDSSSYESCNCTDPKYKHVPGYHQCSTDGREKTCRDNVAKLIQNRTITCDCVAKRNYTSFLDDVLRPVNGANKTYAKEDLASVKIYFREIGKTVNIEEPTYTLNQFLTEFGGMSALFVGVSMISIVEIIELILTLITIPFITYPPWTKKWSGRLDYAYHEEQVRPTTAKDIEPHILESDIAVNERPLPATAGLGVKKVIASEK